MPLIIKIIFMTFLLLIQPMSFAVSQQFQAPIDIATWNVAEPHPLRCYLSHKIPDYGWARFSQIAGKPLAFSLKVEQALPKQSVGVLRSEAPMWLPNLSGKHLAKVKVKSGLNIINLPEKQAHQMVSELERGWVPTFIHDDWAGKKNNVKVQLSSINFPAAFTDYHQCLKQLLPYGFDDIKSLTFYYAVGSTHLNREEKKLLDRLIRYVEVDEDVSSIVVKSYSDSMGDKRGNYLLSIERLRTLESYLHEKNVAEKMIDATAYGERYPAASNQTVRGRALNRRVTVKLIR